MINVPNLEVVVRVARGGQKLIARDHGMPVNPFAPCATTDNDKTNHTQIDKRLT